VEFRDRDRRSDRWGVGSNGLSRIEDFDWIVFTSANAVERCWRYLGDGRGLACAKVAVIGSAQPSLSRPRRQADLMPERFVAESW